MHSHMTASSHRPPLPHLLDRDLVCKPTIEEEVEFVAVQRPVAVKVHVIELVGWQLQDLMQEHDRQPRIMMVSQKAKSAQHDTAKIERYIDLPGHPGNTLAGIRSSPRA